ncbi:MAG: retroviral aspartyl protease domain protein [Betaproteobacteria bacterium]|jgi:aspartyl protease family protein|nr:retroviral aspartyl protease domain protein [Betaproteobacteria bacterium]
MESNPHSSGGKLMLAIAWALIIGGLYWYFSQRQAHEMNPNTAAALSAQRGELTLARNRAGHYLAEGEISGRPVTFLLDTGATWVALPLSLGRELGLKRGAAVTLMTANGPAPGYQTRLASVRLGPLELTDVGAVMSEGLEKEVVLLGMSFLGRVEFTQRGDQLILRQ